jgi:hypothetical protein
VPKRRISEPSLKQSTCFCMTGPIFRQCQADCGFLRRSAESQDSLVGPPKLER